MSTTTPTLTVPTALKVMADVGHPTRIQILLELADGSALSPNAFRQRKIAEVKAEHPRWDDDRVMAEVDRRGFTLGAISYHFRAMHEGRRRTSPMIVLADETRVRGAVEHHYKSTQLAKKLVAPMMVSA